MNRILYDLQTYSHECKGSSDEIEQLLLQVHAFTKKPDINSNLCDVTLAVTTLGLYAFGDVSLKAKQTALRCLYNILYLFPSASQVFVQQQYPKKTVTLIKDQDAETGAIAMLLLCRLGDTAFDFTPYLENDGLADEINDKIAQEARKEAPPSSDSASPLNASLLLLTVISSRCKQLPKPNPFLRAKEPILQLIGKTPALFSPLQLPMSLLIAAVGIILSDDSIRVGGLTISKSDISRITDALFRAMQLHWDEDDFETRILAFVALIYTLASSCEVDILEHLKSILLPSEQDRLLVLGEGDSFPHLLIRLSVKATSSELKFLLAKLLFELSNKDPQQLITNVGFGCASGLLFVIGEEIPRSSETHAQNKNEGINLVTGQRRGEDSEADLRDWTEEDKQREAERLFVLFERLRAAGVGVENPVVSAMREGRFTELED